MAFPTNVKVLVELDQAAGLTGQEYNIREDARAYSGKILITQRL
jgi:hypothetical protein